MSSVSNFRAKGQYTVFSFFPFAEKTSSIMKLLRKEIMFSLRRKQSPFVTVRAEDLQPGDHLVYDSTDVEVLDINQGNNEVRVQFGMSPAGTSKRTWRTSLYPEILITVARY